MTRQSIRQIIGPVRGQGTHVTLSRREVPHLKTEPLHKVAVSVKNCHVFNAKALWKCSFLHLIEGVSIAAKWTTELWLWVAFICIIILWTTDHKTNLDLIYIKNVQLHPVFILMFLIGELLIVINWLFLNLNDKSLASYYFFLLLHLINWEHFTFLNISKTH